MKKKSLITMLVALSLVGVVLVGATLAYLSDTTGEVENTFTVGNVDVDLVEPDWDPDEDGKNLEPGASVDKNPMIVNTGKNAGYVLMSVDGMEEMAAAGFSAVYDAANWTLVDADGKVLEVPANNALVDGYYAYNAVLAAGETTKPLFEKVTFNGGEQEETVYTITAVIDETNGQITHYEYVIDGETLEAATYEEAEAALIAEYGDALSFVFNLTVKGYAIQTTGFEETGMEGWVPAVLGEDNAE